MPVSYTHLDVYKRQLADGCSPRAGKDVKGPTAAAASVAKLDHEVASNGTLYNQKFLPSAVAGDQGLMNFAAVIRSYFDKKGKMCIRDRITCIRIGWIPPCFTLC